MRKWILMRSVTTPADRLSGQLDSCFDGTAAQAVQRRPALHVPPWATT
jgi:hypothetical protein